MCGHGVPLLISCSDSLQYVSVDYLCWLEKNESDQDEEEETENKEEEVFRWPSIESYL